jgi:uncharacterized repeat protein (TIGR03803 family)
MNTSAPKFWKRVFLLSLSLVTMMATVARAQTFSVLYNLGTNSGDPASPYGPGYVAQGRDGNLYSTSIYGGTGNSGTVFTITPSGTLTVLYRFDITTGEYPISGLSLGRDGNFYGTTVFGGSPTHGVIFKISPGGRFNVVYNFTGGTDGEMPYAPPIQAADGNFYGTTSSGANGWGTIYRLTPSGVFTTLHQFNDLDGRNAHGRLLQTPDGSLYGTTREGGANFATHGTIFKITPAGKFKSLYSFDVVHGVQPDAGLIRGRDGNLYGTTTWGGANSAGVVYRLTLSGALTVIHEFSELEGKNPYAGLVEGTDGNFYGVTSAGGNWGWGTIYRISINGNLSVLYDFDTASGGQPYVALLQHTAGTLFGDTVIGGSANLGTFYSFDDGLKPFVAFVIASGKVGSGVGILGQGFAGAMSVTFNGTAATFNVLSDTYMTATIPIGATSGFVKVVTPSGRLTSRDRFYVIP